MKSLHKRFSTIGIVVDMLPLMITPSQAKPTPECESPPGEAIVEAGLGRTNVSGRLSKKDVALVKQLRARLVPGCATRRQKGDTDNLEEVLRTALALETYSYFAAVWGGGGLTVRGFVSKSTANKLTSLRGPQFPIDALSLRVIESG